MSSLSDRERLRMRRDRLREAAQRAGSGPPEYKVTYMDTPNGPTHTTVIGPRDQAIAYARKVRDRGMHNVTVHT